MVQRITGLPKEALSTLYDMPLILNARIQSDLLGRAKFVRPMLPSSTDIQLISTRIFNVPFFVFCEEKIQ